MNDIPSFNSLDEARNEIDRIDTELLTLLTRRSGVSRAIGQLKSGTYAGASIAEPAFRPAREMRMVRKLKEKCAPQMNFETAFAIWREIVGASSASQAPLIIASQTAQIHVARDTFGVASDLVICRDDSEVIETVMQSKAGIGLLPPVRAEGWNDLPDALNVTCALPFYGSTIDAYAIARTPVEDSGEDVTLALDLRAGAAQEPIKADGLFAEGGFEDRPSLSEKLAIPPQSLRVIGAYPVPLVKG